MGEAKVREENLKAAAEKAQKRQDELREHQARRIGTAMELYVRAIIDEHTGTDPYYKTLLDRQREEWIKTLMTPPETV